MRLRGFAAAVPTLGRILGPGNGLAEQIDACSAHASSFYTISPPAGAKAEEYHELKLQTAKSGLTARANEGYYLEPPET